MSDVKRIQFYIFGKVQGVWFRKSTKEKAQSMGLTGYVKNRHDGTVYAEAEGDIEVLIQFADWCKIGPPLAIVNSIKMINMLPIGSEEFEIR